MQGRVTARIILYDERRDGRFIEGNQLVQQFPHLFWLFLWQVVVLGRILTYVEKPDTLVCVLMFLILFHRDRVFSCRVVTHSSEGILRHIWRTNTLIISTISCDEIVVANFDGGPYTCVERVIKDWLAKSRLQDVNVVKNDLSGWGRSFVDGVPHVVAVQFGAVQVSFARPTMVGNQSETCMSSLLVTPDLPTLPPVTKPLARMPPSQRVPFLPLSGQLEAPTSWLWPPLSV